MRKRAVWRGIKFIPGVELTCDVELPWNLEILEANSRNRPLLIWHWLVYFPYEPLSAF